METPMSIHPEFADWYRAASVAPPQELLDKRWLGVEEAAQNVTALGAIALLRIFCVRAKAVLEAPQFLDDAFRKHDPSFSNRDNLEEIRILSGAVLRHLIEDGGKLAVPVALGLICGSYGDRRSKLSTPEHVGAAEKFLDQRAIEDREVEQVPSVKISNPTKERWDELLPAQHFNPNQTPHLRESLIIALGEQASKVSQGVNKFASALWRTVLIQREEINLLWWLQAKFSREVRKPFSEMSASEASLVLPTELADLTVFIPGSPAVVGLLISALNVTKKQAGKKASLVDAVNSTPREWRKKRVAQLPKLDDLTPVLLAMSKSLETDGETEWPPVYRTYCEVPLDNAIGPDALAVQAYREYLFVRAISENEK
jgi:hypothetical protein